MYLTCRKSAKAREENFAELPINNNSTIQQECSRKEMNRGSNRREIFHRIASSSSRTHLRSFETIHTNDNRDQFAALVTLISIKVDLGARGSVNKARRARRLIGKSEHKLGESMQYTSTSCFPTRFAMRGRCERQRDFTGQRPRSVRVERNFSKLPARVYRNYSLHVPVFNEYSANEIFRYSALSRNSATRRMFRFNYHEPL